VTKLFNNVNGRRCNEYSPNERSAIDTLINEISNTNWDWDADLLPGKWMLVYLQPGPTGAGVDRRIPFFPEFNFNDQYQIFTDTEVRNIGELWGPLTSATVSGKLKEENPSRRNTPKRYKASIDHGSICLSTSNKSCLPLPISGEGLFDGVYLGKRLRIGQNVNGGGARVVQVRLKE